MATAAADAPAAKEAKEAYDRRKATYDKEVTTIRDVLKREIKVKVPGIAEDDMDTIFKAFEEIQSLAAGHEEGEYALERKRTEKEHEEEKKKALEELTEQKKELEERNAGLLKDVESAGVRVTELENEEKELKKKVTEMEKEPTRKIAEIAELNKHIRDVEEQLTEALPKIDEYKEKLKEETKQRKVAEDTLEKARGDYSALSEDTKNMRKEHDKELAKVNKKVTDLESELQVQKKLNEEQEKQISELNIVNGDDDEAQRQIKELRARIPELKLQVKRLTDEKEELKGVLAATTTATAIPITPSSPRRAAPTPNPPAMGLAMRETRIPTRPNAAEAHWYATMLAITAATCFAVATVAEGRKAGAWAVANSTSRAMHVNGWSYISIGVPQLSFFRELFWDMWDG